jgi:hypothetical protein
MAKSSCNIFIVDDTTIQSMRSKDFAAPDPVRLSLGVRVAWSSAKGRKMRRPSEDVTGRGALAQS